MRRTRLPRGMAVRLSSSDAVQWLVAQKNFFLSKRRAGADVGDLNIAVAPLAF